MYTLVIIDLKKCNLILNSALEMTSIKEAKKNIVQSIAHFASKSSLDTFFLILLVALGNLSDSQEIKSFSSFSCILLASNFLLFITIYPALLSLILQVQKIHHNYTSRNCLSVIFFFLFYFSKFKKNSILFSSCDSNSGENKSENKNGDNMNSITKKELSTNPVLVYVKVLMTLFLFLIHLKLLFFNEHNFLSSEGKYIF
jgi:hypothetical protein